MEPVSPETLVIGGKFWGHDSSVFMVMPKERRIAALQTERVTRYKHDSIYPIPAILKLVERERIDAAAVKRVVFSNPFLVLEKAVLAENWYDVEMLFRSHFGSPYQKDVQAGRARFEARSKIGQVTELLASRPGRRILVEKALLYSGMRRRRPLADIERTFLRNVFPNAEIDIRFYDHEYCHAMCAYVTAPFEQMLVCTMDGWGDTHFSHIYEAHGKDITPLVRSPRTFDPSDFKWATSFWPSLGGIYAYFTAQLGFVHEQDEGKVEALAAYGEPVRELLALLDSFVTVEEDDSLTIDTKAFMQSFAPDRFAALRDTYSKEQLSATVQAFLQRTMHAYIGKLVEKTGITNLAFAGGIAANVINNLDMYERITPNLHITPAIGDDGSPQGAAFAYLIESGEDVSWIKALEMPYYETAYTRDEVRAVLQRAPGVTYEDLGAGWPEKTAQLLVDGKIGAIFHGRAEWGPRALGHRSIIADSRRKDFRDLINKTIKRRPLFQPFCPSILAEERERLFESAYLNKHMTTAFRLKEEFREQLPSATHIDGTARAQFVEEKDDANYYHLLKKVKELTGFGIVINTSFNKHGRTIVESPEDAIRDFLDTDMDYLVIEGFLVTRTK